MRDHLNVDYWEDQSKKVLFKKTKIYFLQRTFNIKAKYKSELEKLFVRIENNDIEFVGKLIEIIKTIIKRGLKLVWNS